MSQALRSKAIDQAVWSVALRLGGFSYASLAAEAHVSMRRVQDLVKIWRGGKTVEYVGTGPLGRHLFKVSATALQRGPELVAGRDGTRTVEQNMWSVMHRQRAFSPTDLVALGNTTECQFSQADASSYCQTLLRAGYLRVLRKAVPGKIEASYRLIRYTGPLPPVSRRTTVVLDQNLDKIVHVARAAEGWGAEA